MPAPALAALSTWTMNIQQDSGFPLGP